MEFIKVVTNKKRYIDLLLLIDEEEKMIDKYIKKGIWIFWKKRNLLKELEIIVQGIGEF